ncbi:hypothetical protein QBC36DRAFT_320926, partial [Triangularia setosa]
MHHVDRAFFPPLLLDCDKPHLKPFQNPSDTPPESGLIRGCEDLVYHLAAVCPSAVCFITHHQQRQELPPVRRGKACPPSDLATCSPQLSLLFPSLRFSSVVDSCQHPPLTQTPPPKNSRSKACRSKKKVRSDLPQLSQLRGTRQCQANPIPTAHDNLPAGSKRAAASQPQHRIFKLPGHSVQPAIGVETAVVESQPDHSGCSFQLLSLLFIF